MATYVFIDLHGVLADISAVGKNYLSYLQRILEPTGMCPDDIALAHDKALGAWVINFTKLTSHAGEEALLDEEFMALMGKINQEWENTLLDLVPDASRELVRPFVASEFAEFEAMRSGDPATFYPDVKPFLDQVSTVPDLSLHVASSASEAHVRGTLELGGFDQLFTSVIGHDTVQAPKKSRHGIYFDRLISYTGADPRRSLFIGDSIEEAMLSLKTGMACVLVVRDESKAVQMKESLDVAVFPDLVGMAGFVKDMSQSRLLRG